MYYGSIRYWLYSIPMSKDIRERVQSEANTLLWSKEPDLDKAPVRYRRFVAKRTAIGPRSKGGLKCMDWESHVTAFLAE